MRNTVSCPQYIYGKLASDSRGTIIPGSEHGCTGRSHDFPAELIQRCHPGRIGFGLNNVNSMIWGQYPWRAEGGGIVCHFPNSPSGRWLLAGRVCGRSEGGDQEQGRFYQQAHFVAIPAAEWSLELLPALARRLTTAPQMRSDMDLPPLELVLDGDRIELTPNWNFEVAEILTVVLSGQAISVQDWTQGVEPFLTTIACCLALMPREVEHGFGIGSGVVDMDGTLRIAMGMRAMSGIRKLSGELRGAGSLSEGEAYVRQFTSGWRDCRTLRDLLAWTGRIRKSPTRRKEVTTARTKVPFHLPEPQDPVSKSLCDWLGGAGDRPILAMIKDRDKALQLIIDNVRDRGGELLAETLEGSWAEAWKRTGGGARLLGEVIGAISPATLAGFAEWRSLDLPDDLARAAAGRLEELLIDARDAIGWSELAVSLVSDARWLQNWLGENWNRVVWLVLDEVRNDRAPAEWKRLKGVPLRDAIEKIRKKHAPKPEETLLIAENAVKERAECFDWLVMKACEAKFHLCAITMARNSGVECPSAERLFETVEFACGLAADLSKRNEKIVDDDIRILLSHWSEIPSARRHKLAEKVASCVGQPWAEILVSSKEPSHEGPYARIARDVFVLRASYDKQLLQEGIEILWALADSGLSEHALGALSDLLPRVNAVMFPGLGLLQSVFDASGPIRDIPQIKPQELMRARSCLRALRAHRFQPNHLLRRSAEPAAALMLLEVIPELRADPLDRELLSSWLPHSLGSPEAGSRWREQVIRLGLQTTSGWRLLAGEACEVDEEEHLTTMQLTVQHRCALACRGVKLLSEAMSGMGLVGERQADLAGARELLAEAERNGDSGGRLRLATLAASMAAREGLERDQIESEVLQFLGLCDSTRHLTGPPSTWPEVMARSLEPEIRQIIRKAFKDGDR